MCYVFSTENLGESLHSFNFAPGFSRGTFASSPVPGRNSSLNASWQFYNFIGGAETSTVLPTTTRSPVCCHFSSEIYVYLDEICIIISLLYLTSVLMYGFCVSLYVPVLVCVCVCVIVNLCLLWSVCLCLC